MRLTPHAPCGAGLVLGHQALERPSGVGGHEDASVVAQHDGQLARVVRGLRDGEDALGLPDQIPLSRLGGGALDPEAHNGLIARSGGFLTAPESEDAAWVFAC